MSAKKKKIAAFNWKLDPTSIEAFNETHKHFKKLAKKYDSIDVIFAPPVQALGIKLGSDGNLKRASQTISTFDSGAHTGSVSGTFLKNMGINYSIIGHSEERARMGLRDDDVAEIACVALHKKIIPIVCFGESARDSIGKYAEFLEKQIVTVFDALSNIERKKVILAYEPIWAIGKDATRPITSEELFSTIILIKNILARSYGEQTSKQIKVLYGGSVKAHNAEELAKVPGVSGFLVGSASHKHDQVEAIIAALQ